MLKQMGYTPGSALGKEGSGRAEPVGLEIRRTRAGIGREDPIKEKMRREEAWTEKKRKNEAALMAEFGCRQKSQWQSRRVVVNFKKAKGALDQLENKEIVEPKKKEDEDSEEGEEEEEEEEITEEVCFFWIISTIWFLGLLIASVFNDKTVGETTNSACCWLAEYWDLAFLNAWIKMKI